MKAAFLVKTGKSNHAFEIRDTEIPSIKNHEVLIKVETFGLNYADVMARNGIYAAAPPLPSILGYEAVGVIKEIGKDVTHLKIGERVLAFTRFGAYAEFCVAHSKAVAILPKEIPNDIATALATQYCTAIYAADWMANIKPFERVLIHAGAGGVGHGLIQYAKQVGCEVMVTAGSDEKITYLKSLGVDHAINYSNHNFVTELVSKFGERPINAIFDPIGGKNYKLNRQLLAVGGRMIMFGVSAFSKKKGTIIDKLQLAAQFGILSPLDFLIKSNGVIGVNMLHIADQNPQIINALLKQAISGYLNGIYQPKIAFSGSIDELAKAHNSLESRGTIGKLAISW
jgi:NADPH2:quinone reductase